MYHREFGVTRRETCDGQPVTSVAAPDWSGLTQLLDALPPETAGVVVTPELATSPGIPLDELGYHEAMIERRIAEATDISQQFPQARLLLGSVAFEHSGMTNALFAIENGALYAEQTYRKYGLTIPERSAFVRGQPREHDSATQIAICADLITMLAQARGIPSERPRLLGANVRTLLVSSCWAVPGGLDMTRPAKPDEERFRQGLERVVGGVFDGYDRLEQVIVTDRSTRIDPLGAEFLRS